MGYTSVSMWPASARSARLFEEENADRLDTRSTRLHPEDCDEPVPIGGRGGAVDVRRPTTSANSVAAPRTRSRRCASTRRSSAIVGGARSSSSKRSSSSTRDVTTSVASALPFGLDRPPLEIGIQAGCCCHVGRHGISPAPAAPRRRAAV